MWSYFPNRFYFFAGAASDLAEVVILYANRGPILIDDATFSSVSLSRNCVHRQGNKVAGAQNTKVVLFVSVSDAHRL